MHFSLFTSGWKCTRVLSNTMTLLSRLLSCGAFVIARLSTNLIDVWGGVPAKMEYINGSFLLTPWRKACSSKLSPVHPLNDTSALWLRLHQLEHAVGVSSKIQGLFFLVSTSLSCSRHTHRSPRHLLQMPLPETRLVVIELPANAVQNIVGRSAPATALTTNCRSPQKCPTKCVAWCRRWSTVQHQLADRSESHQDHNAPTFHQ